MCASINLILEYKTFLSGARGNGVRVWWLCGGRAWLLRPSVSLPRRSRQGRKAKDNGRTTGRHLSF